MNLIDKDALMRTLGITDMDCDKCAWCDKEWSRCKRGSDFEDACCAIENAPTIEERKTGRWKRTYLDHEAMGERPSIFYCSVCNQCIAYPVNYCPSCGADMRGGGQDE